MRTQRTARDRTRHLDRGVGWWIAGFVVLLLVAAGVAVSLAFGHKPLVPVAGVPSSTPSTTVATTIPSAAVTTAPTPRLDGSSSPSVPSSPAPTAHVTSPGPVPTLRTVEVTVVTAAWQDGSVVVSGYAAVVENGGTCTLTLTRGTAKVTGTSVASADAATADCQISIRDEKLTSGPWRAVLSYASGTATGTSTPTTITIG